MSEQHEEYDRAFNLAVIILNQVPGVIELGKLSLGQRTTVRDALYQEGAGRQDRALALEQIAAITEDDFFLKAARRTLGGQGMSDGIIISTRRL